MRGLAVFIFIILYCAALVRPIYPVINYSLNKDFIVEFFCVNKDKPQLQCNGKCHLAEQLKKMGDDSENSNPKIDIRLYPVGFVQLVDSNFKRYVEGVFKFSPLYLNYSFVEVISIFHPPN